MLAAFDKFKDSISASRACEVAAAAVAAGGRDWPVELCPLSDGGEGFAQILTEAAGGRTAGAEVAGPRGQAVVGLPGNPASTLICLIRFVIPAIFIAMGTRRTPAERIGLAKSVHVDLPLAHFLPVVVQVDEWGQPWASPRPTNTSGDFLSLIGTDGIVELPAGPMTCPKGFVAPLYRW